MRLSHKLLSIAAVGALALAGCSSAEDSAAEGSEATPANPAGEAGAFPATVETKFGAETITEAPQRVVALGWGDAEIALALGVQPIGASDWLEFGGNGQGEWAKGLYAQEPELIGTLEPSYEAIAALDPDLILDVRGSGEEERHKNLAQIAPTIGIPKGGDAWMTGLEEHVKLIAAALGRPQAGQELIEKVDQTFTDIAAVHPEWQGKTVTAAAKSTNGWAAYVSGGGRLDTLRRFGFVSNPAIDALPVNEGKFSVTLSPENLDMINADLIVGFAVSVDAADMEGDPQWQALQTVKDGRAIVLERKVSQAFSLGTPLALIHAAEVLTPQFEALLPAQ